MAFNFPNSPTDQMPFTPYVGGPSYIWDAATSAWKYSGGAGGGGSASLTVSDTPPASPQPNQLWWESDSGALYLYYGDPDSSQWVMIAPGVYGKPPVIGDLDMQGYAIKNVRTINNYAARPRNRVTNPTAQVSQENGTTAVTANAAYPADQWRLAFGGIVGWARRATLTTASPEGTITGVAITATTAKASLAATDYLIMQAFIEGLDVVDLGWGTTAAKPVVLRFCAICDTAGTYGFSIRNSAVDRSYCGSFTIATAGVPQVFSFAIPADFTGTWLKDTGIGMQINFVYAAGSTNIGVAGWQAGGALAPPGCTNGAAIANAVLTITDLGLYKDIDNTGLAPPFEAPSWEDDLARCMRYWENGYVFLQSPAAATIGGTSSYNVKKRIGVTPVFSNVAYSSASGLAAQAAGQAGGISYNVAASIAGGYVTFIWTANARLA